MDEELNDAFHRGVAEAIAVGREPAFMIFHDRRGEETNLGITFLSFEDHIEWVRDRFSEEMPGGVVSPVLDFVAGFDTSSEVALIYYKASTSAPYGGSLVAHD